ncbi:hypothetical protein V8E36_004207 [Tilletia maclaganii]
MPSSSSRGGDDRNPGSSQRRSTSSSNLLDSVRGSFAAIGQAVRGMFRSSSEDRLSARGQAHSQSTSALPGQGGQAHSQSTSAIPGQGAGSGATAAAAAPAASNPTQAAPTQLPPGQAADLLRAADGVEINIDFGALAQTTQAIQAAAAFSDELFTARGQRPSSPTFGTAREMTPPPPSSESVASASTAEAQAGQAAASAGDSGATSSAGVNSGSQAVPGPAATNATNDAAPATQPAAAGSNAPDPPPDHPTLVLFRLPFTAPDGRQALLAFRPVPLPGVPANQATGPDGAAAPTANDPVRANPHPSGHVPLNPIFVPAAVSPFAFAMLYDANLGLGWPVMPTDEILAGVQNRPHLVAGMPFQIMLQFANGTGAEEEEQPSKEKAEKYVANLERADAELRERMARLGLGDIGDYSEPTSSLMETNGSQGGCGICMEEFEPEDKPAWLVGRKAEDEAVVAVPCAGHHTLHASCLREWLEVLKPSAWTCPFCRAPLKIPAAIAGNSITTAGGAAGQGSPSSTTTTTAADDEKRRAEEAAQARSLRDEVRLREKQRGWRCDAAACLPRYPPSKSTAAGSSGDTTKASGEEASSTSVDPEAELLKLAPCHHEIHVGCLRTAMRVEDDLLSPAAEEVDFDAAEEEEDDNDKEDEDDADDEMVDSVLIGPSDNGPSSQTAGAAEWSDRKRKRDDLEPSSLDSDDLVAGPSASTHMPESQPQPTTGRTRRTVSKWVSCPTCRCECWAEIPVESKKSSGREPGRRRRRLHAE